MTGSIDPAISAALIAIASGIALGLLKVSFQAGRIERGVKGLYGRIERIERWIDRHDDRER